MDGLGPAARRAPSGQAGPTDRLPDWRSLLVVVAHPDDESFGLGAVVEGFVAAGATVDVLCFTRGEASTLGTASDLAAVRANELKAAADALGMRDVTLLGYPDGRLAETPVAALSERVVAVASRAGAEGLLVFDSNGVTGHPDHVAATAASVVAAQRLGIDALAWCLPADVADGLRLEGPAMFHGRQSDEIDVTIRVSRTRQRRAVSCHPSQIVPGGPLWRRLALQGSVEHLRWLARAV